MGKKLKLFEIGDEKSFDGWEEWVGMPEYNNVKIEPEVVVTIRFLKKEHFDDFHQKIKEHLYSGEKVFDGMQRKEAKSTWYPLREKASNYEYI